MLSAPYFFVGKLFARQQLKIDVLPMIGKLFSWVGIGSTVAKTSTVLNAPLLQRILAHVINVIVLVIMSVFLVGLLLTAAFSGLYLIFIHNGLDPIIATMTIIGFVFILMIICIVMTISALQQLQKLPYDQILRSEIPSLSRIHAIVHAFLNGFNKRALHTK